MLPRLEAQIERFAPGFREIVLARHVLDPSRLESMDANLVGGDIAGGVIDLRQMLYLCSSSTPPGGGVHGMCGFHAARRALADLKR